MCRSLASNALILASDNYYVLSVMSDNTLLPKKTILILNWIVFIFLKNDKKLIDRFLKNNQAVLIHHINDLFRVILGKYRTRNILDEILNYINSIQL